MFFLSFADGKKVRVQGQRLLSNRTVKCLTNVEAFSLRAGDLEELTILFTRFLRNPHVLGALRYFHFTPFPCCILVYLST